jgi:hypothetical protein
MTGAATEERTPRARTSWASSLVPPSQLSIRAGARVRTISPARVSAAIAYRVPTGTCVSRRLQPAIVTLKPSGVYLDRLTELAPTS